ncbi:MAG: lipoate protein ligase C-terminal domain-containing protein [Planctomycetota bacterium]|nr:lipoate protein ligase C-terminal domain-containing protein [Planctomycetota bacterium]
MTWQLITADGVEAAHGLAADEVLCRQVGAGRSPATLRLYTYRSHCALVGRFQNLAQELHLDYCEGHDVQINRRPTGGGAILMGRDQLGITVALNGRGPAMHGRARDLMEQFSGGLLHGLQQLGVAAKFRGKNDLEVGGRKIAGLGIYRDSNGGLLFHGSLLVDLDVPLMARVLRTPFTTIGNRELRIIAKRTTTVREQRGDSIGIEDVRQCVANGFEESFGIRLQRSEHSDEELAAIDALAQDKYFTRAWLHQRSNVPDLSGRQSIRTDAGSIEARVSMAGKTIKSAILLGDFFADEDAIVDLEGRLRWHSSDAAAIEETIREWAYATSTNGLDPVAIAKVVLAATEGATEDIDDTVPYGCFVTPTQPTTPTDG